MRIILACAVLALSSTARAQPAPDETAIARGHYKTGEAYYTSGRFAEAAREFEEAYKFFGSRELLFNMGRAYDRAGDYVHARDRYRSFLKDATGNDAVELERRVDELAWHVARVTLHAPAGATVRLDGAELGTAPIAPLELNPGLYHFEVSRDGFATWSRAITLGDGGKQTLDAQLVPIAAAQPKTPLYKKWWLWTAVGVVVAAAAVTGGVLGAQSSSSPSGIGSTLPVVR